MQSYSVKFHLVDEGVEDMKDRWIMVAADDIGSAEQKARDMMVIDIKVLGVKPVEVSE